MHVIDDMYVERRAVSARSAPHAVFGLGEERFRGVASCDAVEMSDFLGQSENPTRTAGTGGGGFTGSFMPSQQAIGGLQQQRQHHRRATGSSGDASGEMVYVHSAHGERVVYAWAVCFVGSLRDSAAAIK